jgi:SAM-dependent methyltransferase
MTSDSNLTAAFGNIYRSKTWGHGSGPGSSETNTIEYRAFITRFMEANSISTVTDLGCGDWQFSQFLSWSGVDYVGLDVVPEIVEHNRRHFARPNIRFAVFSGTECLPGGDLLLAKEVLQHLPNATIAELLNAVRRKYRFALITNSTEPRSLTNRDIEPGGFRPLRLQDAPFDTFGAVVFTYFPQSGSHLWKNAVFLMPGNDGTFNKLPPSGSQEQLLVQTAPSR